MVTAPGSLARILAEFIYIQVNNDPNRTFSFTNNVLRNFIEDNYIPDYIRYEVKKLLTELQCDVTIGLETIYVKKKEQPAIHSSI